MKNKFKRFLSYIGIFILAGAVIAGSSFSAYASRVSDYANSPDNLTTIQRYNKAMETCIPGGLGGSFSYDYSGSGKYQVEKNIQKSYDHLMGGQYFFKSLSGNLIYSEEFEKNISQGSYDGGVFGSGNDDGKMYCGENNSALLGNALSVFGLQKDAATLKSLYCDGNKDGIFTITKKKYDSNYKVVEEDSNCSENFDLFVQYAQNKTTDPVYSISVSPSSNAGNYYKQWFKNKVGDLSSITSDQKKALAYADAAHNFVTLCSVSGPSDSSFNSKSEVKIYDAFSGKASSSTKEVYYQIGVDADDKFYTGINGKTEQTCAEMAASLTKDGAAAYAKVMGIAADNPGENPTAPIDPNAGGITGSEKTCYDGAGALGWVLCPILEGLADTTSDIYTNVVEPSLRTEPGLLTDNGVADVWGIFRNLANIAFAILLLVIIFSQVTGVGIDNYGIKKTLPKLIVAAVLINLSYIICQLAVDLSNILGSSLKGMLDNLSGSVSTAISYGGASTSSATVSGGATVLSIFLPLIVAAGAILAQGWAILLPLIMVAISAVIAVIFVFLLLSVRKAGVVILVAISPLAFVCYMLPNTKKLFDKWLKMFEGLLLLYPICGLLIGGGNFASKILLRTNMGNDNFFFALSAMLINIAPFFFIPTVLKGSFAAMGNIGAKISGFGKSLSGRANKAVGGSEWYKNAGLRAKGGIDSNGNVTKFGQLRSRIASKTGFGRAGMARARAGAIKANGDIKKNNMLLSDNYAEAARAAQDSAMNKEALENEMSRIKAGGPIDNDRYNSELQKLLAQESLTDGQKMQAKAYMKLLANGGGYGKKLLAGTMAGASTGTRGFAAQFMSKDADVAGAVASKNAAAAQYLREVNAGGTQQYFDANGNVKTTGEAGSFEDWKSLKRREKAAQVDANGNVIKDANGKIQYQKDADGKDVYVTGVSNAQFVANNITDKDEDFIAQSDGAIKAAIADKAVTDDRLRAIYDNDLLYNSATEEVRKVISTHLGRPYNRADYTPESGGGFPTELTIEHSDGRRDTIKFGSGSPAP